MSARRFARDVPRSVQTCVRVADDIADENGEIPGGMPALQEALGHDNPSSTRRAVIQAEGWGLMRRSGPIGHGPRRVFVVARANPHACATPGCDRVPLGGNWCPTCKQVRRADRDWHPRAIEMLVAGMSPPLIASTVSRPLFPDVVFHLLAEVPDLVQDEWREALRETHPQLIERLTERVRRRRADARKRLQGLSA
jgi:hypothetical protein